MIKGFSQRLYFIDSVFKKSFVLENGVYVDEKNHSFLDSVSCSINLNYGENDIISFGIRIINNKDNIIDLCIGTTSPNYHHNEHSIIAIYKIGLGRRINEDLSLGIDYIFSEKTQYDNLVIKYVENANHNIGLFISYKIYNQVDLNFTSNSCTGNSVGISLSL